MYDVQYPLREWGWNREECKRQVDRAGLPVPVKSACFFCPASKKPEIQNLPSDLYQLSVGIENNYRSGKHWRGADATVVGLGRKFQWADVGKPEPKPELF